MRRAFIFLFTVAALIILIGYVSTAIPASDPFGASSESSTFSADGVSQSMIARMKLRHAMLTPERYDVGLFGNSRVLNVSAQDFEHQGCRVFNFAVGGESLRASAALIEKLIDIKKVPRVIVISADHFELQIYNNPFFVSALDRLRNFSSDLMAAFDAGAGLRQIATVAWRAVWTQTLAFQRMFEYAFLQSAISHMFGVTGPGDGATFYLADGSRRTDENIDDEPPLLAPTSAQIPSWQLRHDLERIAAARSHGAEAVVIYESPLHPDSAAYFNQNPSTHATQLRRTFVQTCDDLGITCVTGPPDQMPTRLWSDAAHPPASVLGPHIGDLIAPHQSVCRP